MRHTKRGWYMARTPFTSFLTIALLVLISGPLSLAQRASADNEPVHQFNIRPQSLADALLEFSKQADQQVVGASEVIGTQQTRGVSGRLTSKAALARLLEATGLTFAVVDARTVRIYAISPRTTLRSSSSEHVASQGEASISGQATQGGTPQNNYASQERPSAVPGKRADAVQG